MQTISLWSPAISLSLIAISMFLIGFMHLLKKNLNLNTILYMMSGSLFSLSASTIIYLVYQSTIVSIIFLFLPILCTAIISFIYKQMEGPL